MKKKKCKECKELFEPQRPLQYLCSPYCAYQYSSKKVDKKLEKEDKKRIDKIRDELKTKKDFIKLLQIVFNKYIRLRDEKEPCISCGRKDVEEFHAGHFIATTYQYHRFNEDNVHKQCSYCNTHLRGNIIEYRKNLINKIGLCRVEYLENTKNMMFDWTREDLQEKIKEYKNKIKKICN